MMFLEKVVEAFKTPGFIALVVVAAVVTTVLGGICFRLWLRIGDAFRRLDRFFAVLTSIDKRLDEHDSDLSKAKQYLFELRDQLEHGRKGWEGALAESQRRSGAERQRMTEESSRNRQLAAADAERVAAGLRALIEERSASLKADVLELERMVGAARAGRTVPPPPPDSAPEPARLPERREPTPAASGLRAAHIRYVMRLKRESLSWPPETRSQLADRLRELGELELATDPGQPGTALRDAAIRLIDFVDEVVRTTPPADSPTFRDLFEEYVAQVLPQLGLRIIPVQEGSEFADGERHQVVGTEWSHDQRYPNRTIVSVRKRGFVGSGNVVLRKPHVIDFMYRPADTLG